MDSVIAMCSNCINYPVCQILAFTKNIFAKNNIIDLDGGELKALSFKHYLSTICGNYSNPAFNQVKNMEFDLSLHCVFCKMRKVCRIWLSTEQQKDNVWELNLNDELRRMTKALGSHENLLAFLDSLRDYLPKICDQFLS